MNNTAMTPKAYTYISIGEAGAPGPTGPTSPGVGGPPGPTGPTSALTNAAIKREKVKSNLLIAFIYFILRFLC